MCFFNKRTSLKDSGIFNGFTDWHSHILPAVDDGVQTLDESLALLRLYEQLGVKTVWLTPHIMEDVPNTTNFLREGFAELKAAYRGPIELHLGAENMLDSLFEERLRENDFLPIGAQGNHLLVETSYFNPPMNLFGILKRILQKGYFPVLAHPERYLYMTNDDYRKLREMGVKFQLNLYSLLGGYGKSVEKRVAMLIGAGQNDFVGTDVHSLANFSERMTEKIDIKTIKKLLQ